ncbi:hypothetical protein F4802DRAFT_342351 [Xylaria palmicola]|nr:hypothetical protein F4802DRAFT_342351 [Xylaria palmicola]
MASGGHSTRGSENPPRSGAVSGHPPPPPPIRTVAPNGVSYGLLREEEEDEGERATLLSPRFPRLLPGRIRSTGQLSHLRPRTPSSARVSERSVKSALSSAGRKLSMTLDLGRRALGRAASLASKRPRVGSRLRPVKKENPWGSRTRSSSESSDKSLFTRRRLPKLEIPDLRRNVEEALATACSTDTQASESFKILERSPTTHELDFEWKKDQPSKDVEAEFHNMISARRRVRKSKFGVQVANYRLARPTWDESWVLRNNNDNMEDREVIRGLTDALQEQKDYAARLVQKEPHRFPGLEPVSQPGCTLPLYWQHKSTYR